jgi:hypothetical protein
MSFSWIRKWFGRDLPSAQQKGKASRKQARSRPTARPELEWLEDRLSPAITILDSGVGTLDGLLSATQGTITAAQSTGSQTLSRAALQGVGSTVNISITSDSISFSSLTSTLSLQTGTGHSAAFITDISGGTTLTFTTTTNTLATAGGSITLDAGTTLTAANLNTNGGDASLTAGGQAAGNLSAQGILTSGSGNITFTDNRGSITQTGSAVGQAINATASSNISVDGLRGTTVGLTSSSGSVTSAGSNAVQASAQLTVSAATGINLATLAAALQASNSTSGNISITQAASPAQTLVITGTGVVNSVSGGTISITNNGSSITVAGVSTVQSNNGVVTLAATDLQITGTVTSGTARTILTSVSGRAIDLGNNTPGTVGLTEAEVSNVTAGVLQIGSNAAGTINISAVITTPTAGSPGSWNTLVLVNGGTITEAAAGSLGSGTSAIPNLRISSTGPDTLNSVNNVQNLAALVGGSGNAFSINNGTHTLTIPNAGVDNLPGVTTTNGNITLIADNILIQQVVTPGTGTVILEPFTTTLNITVGTASVAGSTFGITNGGLGWITSGVTQVGVSADTGTIAITGAINRTPTSTAPSRSQTLDLVTGNTLPDAVTQSASLSVANLAVQSVGNVSLTNTGNAVDKLAGAVTGTGNPFIFTDSTGFDIGTVAGVTGITTHTGGGEGVTLSAGGSVTQDAGANIVSDNLLLLGTGGYTLTNSGNDVDTLAANVTNSVSYTDADDLAIGTIGVNAVQTVAVTGSSGTFTLMFGAVTQGPLAFNASVAQVQAAMDALTAPGETVVSGSAGNYVVAWTIPGPQSPLTGAGSGGASVSTATTTAGLSAISGVTTNGHDINITASAVTSGTTLTVSQAINTTSTANITLNADQMSLGATVNAHSGIVTLKPTTSGRAITLGTTVSGTLSLLQTDLNNVTAGVLRIGDLGTGGSITVTAAISDAGLGWNTLSLLTEIGASISQNSGAILTVTNLQAGGNTGVSLNQNNVVSTLAGAAASGAFSFTDSANLTVDNVDSGLGFGFGVGIITDGQAVSLTVNVLNDSLTINQHIDTTHNFGNPAPGGANINLSADNMALNNNSPSSTINAGTGGILTLMPFTPANTIAVGGPDAAGQLGIDDNDLSNVTAKAVRIGSTAQTGAVTVDGTINTHAGYSTIDLIAAGSGGAITQTTGSIAVSNLALQASAGIGSSGAIQVVGPISVAFRNSTSNNVKITSTGAMTINTVDQLDGTAGHTIGNFASGGTETLQASSPMTFAASDTSSGTITATTTETSGESVPAGQLPPPDDDLIVNSPATVESTGGDVTFTSGDGITINSGGTVKSDSGTVSLTAGMGDVDNDATLNVSGTISAATIGISSPGDIVLGQMSVPEATGTLTVTSTGGSIRDDGSDSTFIEAHNINLTAAKAIGGDTQISRDDVLNQDATFKQAIDFDLGSGGTLALSQTGTGGNIQLRNIDGTTNTSVLGGVEPVGTGNQLALIASGGVTPADSGNAAGDLVVDSALSVGANNDNLLLASTSGNHVTVSHTITNTGTGTVTLVASSPINVNAAISAKGSISLASAGNAAGDGVFITANVTASGSGSTISVDANRDINITGTNTTLSTTNATGGAISVTSAEGLPNFPTGGTGVVTMSSSAVIDTSANNSTITVKAGTTSGAGGDITLGTLNANTGAVNVKSFAGSIVDGNGSGTNNVTGGAINLSAGGASGINLDVITSTPATAGVTATTSSGNITLRSTQQLQVDNISAGTTNDVSLTVNNANTAVSSITSLHPNDGTADVTGRTVTLTATGPTTGNTGQIGFFTSSAQFFEVAATTLNATTNNSRLWISLIGGAAIGSVGAGINTALLKTVGGDLTSTHTGASVTTPDVTAAAVNLQSTTASGSFGSAANPLQLQATNLTAAVSGTGNTGSINVRNVAAGGNLNVVGASTLNGAINITVAGGDLTTTAASGTDINAPSNTVTLIASGAIISGTAAGVTDVASSSLGIDPTGVGTSANPLKTAVSTFAANNVGTGGVFVTNTSSALTIGTVGAATGVVATGGNISITTSGNLTVSQVVTTATSGGNAGSVTLTGGTAGGSTINVNAAITGASASVLGGTGGDTIGVTVTGATPLGVNGQGGGDAITVAFGALNAAVNVAETGTGTNTLAITGTAAAETFTVTSTQVTDTSATQQKVTYSGVQGLTINGGNSANVFNVQSTASGVPLTINAGNGNSTGNIGDLSNTLSGIASLITYNSQGGNDGLSVNDQGTSSSQTYTLNGTSLTRSGGITINYDPVIDFFLNVGANGETVDVTPSATTRFHVNGTAPNIVVDTFKFEAGNLVVHTQAGVFTAAGRQPVTFTNFLVLNINNAAGIDTFSGPNTADRGTAFTGLTANERVVQALYLDALGRVGSKAELDGWVGTLNSSGQAAVARGIEHSFEATDRLVKAWYVNYLGRPATGGEETGWVNALVSSTPAAEEKFLSQILATPEFFNHAQTLVPSGTANERYVQALYLLVLNRTASNSEIASGAASVQASGAQAFALGILQSSEYRKNLVEALYNVLLHRPSDTSGFNFWVGSGLGFFDLRIGIESSTEFFNNG